MNLILMAISPVLTIELARYLARTRLKDVDLPISRYTVKRLRAARGISWSLNTKFEVDFPRCAWASARRRFPRGVSGAGRFRSVRIP